MATNHLLPDRDIHRSPDHAAAAQQLAGSLRRARLTLLCGAPGAGKSALLVDGLLPLLRRRSVDTAASVMRRAAEVVLPFPERRSGGHERLAEMVIFLDAWQASPLAGLHDGIDAALRAAGVDPEWHREKLPDRLQSLASRFGSRFLFVLDGFQARPQKPDEAEAREALIDELTHLLTLPLPVNLLVALRADAREPLAALHWQLPRVPIEVFELVDGQVRQVDPAVPAPMPTSPANCGAPAALSAKVSPVTQIASVRPPPPAAAGPAPAPVDPLTLGQRLAHEAANTGSPTRPGELGPAVVARTPAAASHAGSPAPPRRPLPLGRIVLASSVLAVIAIAALVLQAPAPSENRAAVTPEPPRQTSTATLAASPSGASANESLAESPSASFTPSPNASPNTSAIASPTLPALPTAAGRPSFTLRVDAEAAATRLPRELSRALAADGDAQVRLRPSMQALPHAAASAGLAILRYDALQAASRARPMPALGIVAPLYTEELQVVVRADSPLRFIHQIEGRRIDIGAAQGARALTAQALYRQMFGRPLPPAAHVELNAAAALQRLVAGNAGIDAVLLVEAQPAAALAALPPGQRRQLRLLALAPGHPASRRALQTYLPATLREPGGAAMPTVAAMSFLAVTGTPDADESKQLARLATTLCHSLPALQREGDAKWRALKPGLQLETGWPPAAATDAAWRACGAADASIARAAPSADRSFATPPRN